MALGWLILGGGVFIVAIDVELWVEKKKKKYIYIYIYFNVMKYKIKNET